MIYGKQFNLYIDWSLSVMTDIWITDIFYVHSICDMDLSCVLHISSWCISRRFVPWTFSSIDNEENVLFLEFFFFFDNLLLSIQCIEISKARFIGVTIDDLSIQSVYDDTSLPSLLLLRFFLFETPRAHTSMESPYDYCARRIPFAATVSTRNFSF